MIIAELKKLLEENGIKKGDIICVFSDIANLGLPASIKEEVKKRGLNFLLSSYLDTFADAVGKQGLVVMPVFSYSAARKKIFDVKKTKSEVGVLSEYFRKQKDVERSSHPIFSFAARGNRVKSFLQLKNFDCFGEDSILGKLYSLNAKYILFGVGMQESATFVLYSEQKNKVYYRYFKNFPGVIKKNNKKIKVSVKYYVRNVDLNYDYSWRNLENEGVKTGIIKKFKFNGGTVLLMNSQAIDKLIASKLKKNKDYLIKIIK